MSVSELEISAKECLESCIKDFEESAQEIEDGDKMGALFRETMENNLVIEELVELYKDAGNDEEIGNAIHEHISGECIKFAATLYGMANEKLTAEIEASGKLKKANKKMRKAKHRFGNTSSGSTSNPRTVEIMKKLAEKGTKEKEGELQELPNQYFPKLMSAEEFIAAGGMDDEIESDDEVEFESQDPNGGLYDLDNLPEMGALEPLDMSDLIARIKKTTISSPEKECETEA